MNDNSIEKILAILPAYEEAGNIAQIVRALKSQDLDVLVIDDCSTDNTSQIAMEAGAIVLVHPYNLGYGATLETGYLYALENGYRYIVQLDADGQHDPDETRKLLKPVLEDEADLVIGSRFLGKSYKVPFLRRMGIKWFGFIAKVITGQIFTDCTSGYQAMNASVLRFYCTKMFPSDYPDADVLIMLPRAGFQIMEVPVTMSSNPHSKSIHNGILSPFYYVVKMTLSILMVILQKRDSNGY
ncbi:MAG: glycosyltransferase family 2 protein [Candidatus Auribacterota bacterium]|nr:glycosyltransferase family 2 protein [Candidatus Auribacterota bacterium]